MENFIAKSNASMLAAYDARSSLIKEHFGIEQTVLAGGYGYRQVLELVQNGADAILEAHNEKQHSSNDNRIDVLLKGNSLYVANTGARLSEEGVDALLSSHSSPKRGNQIGRFGLGFKSLLRLGGKIDIFTRSSGAFQFNPERCRLELMHRFQVFEAPGLRLAWPLSKSERGNDSILGELSWAETIIRVDVQSEDLLEHLRQEIRAFPSEFLLFFPVAASLTLDNSHEPCRKLLMEPDGSEYLLHDGSESSRWKVAKRDITVTDQHALDDATHIHARRTVPLAWAIPLESRREESGRFWAFFPTHTATYLPGILNAPWKLNSDRNAIIGGEWNDHLMREAALLVVETLPGLLTASDPGRILDAFPRQIERKDDIASILVDALWNGIETAAVIPDATGALRRAAELWQHPRGNADLARQWQVLASGDSLKEFVHYTCLERQRGRRLSALFNRLNRGSAEQLPCLKIRGFWLWFCAIASTELAKAIEVLKLAEAYKKDSPDEWKSILPRLLIIPTESGELVTTHGTMFAPEVACLPCGRRPVAHQLCQDKESMRILVEVMEVKQLDDSLWHTVLVDKLPYPSQAKDEHWYPFWDLLRSAPEAVNQRFIREKSAEIRVRRHDGEWVLHNEVLLPGKLITSDDISDNCSILVDLITHKEDMASLLAIGIAEFPEGVVEVNKHRLLSEWLNYWRWQYKQDINNSASRKYLDASGISLPGGWFFLAKLTGRPNAKLTEQFLSRISSGEFAEELELKHRTNSQYQTLKIAHPLPWFLLEHGMVQIGDEAVRLVAIVDRYQEIANIRILDLQTIGTNIDILSNAAPAVSASEDDIRSLWLALIEKLATPAALESDSLRELWIGAARDRVAPQILCTNRGRIPLEEVFVTISQDMAQRARSAGHTVVTLDEDTAGCWVQYGAGNLVDLMSPKWIQQTGPECLLVSAVPDVAEVLEEEARGTARCQLVDGLRMIISGQDYSMPCLMWEDILLLDMVQLSAFSRADRFRYLIGEVALVGWLKCEPEKALKILGDAQTDEQRARVAQGPSLPERLLLAVGNRKQPLLEALNNLGGMDFIQQCTALQLAELTLAQFGPATLSILKDTLALEGLMPPSRWNTEEARTFVASIGFPAEFASSPEAKREAEEYISGPIELPPLHDFQEEVMDGIRSLLSSDSQRRRAVVSLPTGGGKTRVTVEAAVRLVLEPSSDSRCVIWVAQTDELCEQAVQAFRQVWLNIGSQRMDLRIVRLWGGNPNPAIQQMDKPIVVVASIQTLNNRMGSDGLSWLQQPGLLVVDECHHAITPSYSNLLRWLDAEIARPETLDNSEPPILGLSATPYRTDDDESRRLAKRFNNLWFPAQQKELHSRLRRQGVLSETDYEALESGVSLLKDEMDRLARLPEPWEGLDFENILEAINQRLAGNVDRNLRLVDRIRNCSERSILFFTNSVLHAEEMSARLNLIGIPSAAISSNTPTVARRYFLSRFHNSEIRVLCNHSVLSTGFDAPKTDMILISRQLFSPVRYMQMVGRGLRGEKNGGTARCRIVTVVDNLGRFQDKHPYHYCQGYFNE